ncbi:YoaK family protein [Streptococcus sp. DD12]|uniref:YoaK family protein n=1 Tax=Streptococcus sp. DD12 TaxID=1777880 RepID=UPI000797714F|nr:YoaK family protein [Streptococcus sp. DD12]KXT76642.1 putative membrane protein [Streptococcus sp. DD12]
MSTLKIMPQDSRFTAILLGFIGGALDVFCHMHFDSLVATQTGNIVLLLADLKPDNWNHTLIKCVSIVFFSIGFLTGTYFKDRAKTAYWRTYLLLPLAIFASLLPFFRLNAYLWVCPLAFGTGLMMLTFTGSHIESHPFTILMTSGNYRKMLTSWYYYVIGRQKDAKLKRQANNYTIVVTSFILGALASAVFDRLIGQHTLWLVAIALITVISYYSLTVHRYHLEKSNL